MRLIKFPSIEQYRNVVRAVKAKAQFTGLDEQGEATYNPNLPLPTLTFEGTVKLHGTNASAVISKEGNFWVQSRERIITPDDDNAGFAKFAYENRETFEAIAEQYSSILYDVAIYGEWCGGNIQKGVALSQLPKMFVIFSIALVGENDRIDYIHSKFVKDGLSLYTNDSIKCIYDFPVYTKVIDFNAPEESQNELNRITSEVEEECPVGKEFGVNGIGEGVVWRCTTEGYRSPSFWFKVKGEKHSNSKVKTLAEVDVERINNIKELAERLAHNGRLEQFTQVVYNTLNGGEVTLEKLGIFIKAVMADIFKEDIDIITESGFTGKELSSPVSKICKDYIFKQLQF